LLKQQIGQTEMIIAPSRMEPARIEEIPEKLSDLAGDLIHRSAQLGRNLPARTLADLAAMVRLMNSYYSNRIEGHNTRPRDIERALSGDLDEDPARRALQQEGAAHVRLQAAIDAKASEGTLGDPSTPEFIRWLHQEFYGGASPEALTINEQVTMVPGRWREGDVEVGLHVPPPYDRVPGFMDYFHQRFRIDRMGRTARILAIATGHHRLNWIHPFYDGNGRVSRLVSHAMAHHAGIGAGGLWSVSRGLARGLAGGLPGREEYKAMMQLADRDRQGDRDGRGDRSLSALVSFADWFLRCCLDQINFMTEMFDFGGLGDRLTRYAALHGMRDEAPTLLRAVLLKGEVTRGEVPILTGVSARTAQRLTDEMTKDGILASVTPKGALALRFPSQTHDVLFPRLFADA
jgi:Fic family protein